MELRTHGQAGYKRKYDYIYEVPLLESLRLLLSDEFILDEVQLLKCY